MSDWKLLNTSTASGASSVSFTDLTGYKIFKFAFIDVHANTDAAYFQWQGSINGGSSYGVTWTTTYFYAGHAEDDSPAELAYAASYDQAQTTNFQYLHDTLEDHADASLCGELFLYNPASTTYVKHWHARCQAMFQYSPTGSGDVYTGGYFNNPTNDVDACQFKMSSGTFGGVIKQYGLVAS